MAKGINDHKVTSYVVTDFETGGLKMRECGLTEIAMISLKGDTLEKINEYETLIAPHQILNEKKEWVNAVYSQEAQDINGLTVDLLKRDGKDIDQVAQEVQAFLAQANTFKSKTGYKPVLVAHNAQYEVKCLQNLANGRFDLSKYFHGDEDFFGNFAPHYIDTLDIAKLLWANNSRMTAFKLGDVLSRAGIPIFDAHRAMNDVRPSSNFFEYAIRLLRVAEKSGLVNSIVNKELDEEGKEINVDERSFKFQFDYGDKV